MFVQDYTVKDPSRQERVDAFKEQIVRILLEEIDLAKPDDLAFLESQVRSIARRITDYLNLRDDLTI